MNHLIKMRSFLIIVTFSIGLLVVRTSVAQQSDINQLKKLAEKGDQEAQLSLGMRYRDGKGVPRNYKEAIKWYRRCADEGYGTGLDNVGFMYLRGWGVPEDFTIAAAYFKAGAAKADSQATFNLGNCYFSGQGVEQNYSRAIEQWERAAKAKLPRAVFRLAELNAAGEGMPQDLEKAKRLCHSVARSGYVDAMPLLGEIHAKQGDMKEAREWWEKADVAGNTSARTLLQLSKWRDQDSVPGKHSYVALDHLFQGWNNCGSTSLAMFLRFAGANQTPYDVKRLCPRSPIGTGTDWADLVAAGKSLGYSLKMLTFSSDDEGFTGGVKVIREHLDEQRPVVIDFTVIREEEGEIRRNGHTLLVVGYHTELDQFVLQNPNQPSPGLQLMSSDELKKNWYSRGYSRVARGRAARPLIVFSES